MSAHIYQSLLRSLKKWPVDQTKKGRYVEINYFAFH